jgi:hypothetical protein
MLRASVLLCLLVAHAGDALGLPIPRDVVGPTEKIPREGFTSWSLFLVCTPDWVTPERSKDLASLYRKYHAFGDAIGSENVAVWFWKKKGTLSDAKLSENVDVARSATFCRALGLKPSEGPFVVVTNAYPELPKFPEERAVFALGALEPAELSKLFNKLTDKLLLEGAVESPPLPAAPAPTPAPAPAGPASPALPGSVATSLWIHLLESARQSIIGFGCAVKLQINTGVVSAEIRGCAG